jgi:xanthine dehydrogenase accessory factor
MNVNTYKSLLDEVNRGEKVIVVTKLCNADCKCKTIGSKIVFTENSLNTYCNEMDFDETIYQKAKYALEFGNPQFVTVSDKEAYLIEPYFPEPRLIVFGGGHIAKPLVEFGAKAGFSVTVIDDRPSFANRQRFPDAENVICESFKKCFSLINLNQSAFAVIVTRGHRYDMDCLKQILKYDTAYTGMIGSKRRVKSVMEQLLNEGYSKEKLDKVNAPIGLEIGAITPEEIAFSIISQVISYRRLRSKKTGIINPLKTNWPEFDKDVLMELTKEDEFTKAIITIVSTKGSVPRKAGAKMIVNKDGRIIGSIGGGCSEGSVIVTAHEVIRSGMYQTQRVDMTGYIAEEEGMVCGGIMDVVIEPF